MNLKKPNLRLFVLCALLGAAVGLYIVLNYQAWTRPDRVFLVIIDTLPASHVGTYGYERNITPSLDAFAAEGVRFENAISTAPWTLPSIAGILTGTLPSVHQAGWRLNPRSQLNRMSFAKMRNDVPSLAARLRKNGYYTIGFFNNPFVSPEWELDRGFDEYRYHAGTNYEISRADRVVEQAKQWIESRYHSRYLMVIHFFDPHLCYDPLPEYEHRFTKDYQGELAEPFCSPNLDEMRYGDVLPAPQDRDFIKGLYDAEVVATDRALGDFLSWLKQKGIYKDALIAVTADHGEEFWEHGGFEHGHTLYQEVLRVPLVIKFPDRALFRVSPRTVEEYVSTADIFPTIVSYLKMEPPAVKAKSLYNGWGGIKKRQGTIVAMNLLWGLEDKFAFYTDGIKVIVNKKTLDVRAYNLAEDPDETENIYEKKRMPGHVKDRINQLLSSVKQGIKNSAPRKGEISSETANKLKSLGYLDK